MGSEMCIRDRGRARPLAIDGDEIGGSPDFVNLAGVAEDLIEDHQINGLILSVPRREELEEALMGGNVKVRTPQAELDGLVDGVLRVGHHDAKNGALEVRS